MNSLRILNLGAGVQSTTVALMGVKNWHSWQCSEPLPFPAVGLLTHAIFADTQEEPKAVYEHLAWLIPKCERFFKVLVVSAGKLGDQLIEGIPIRNPSPSLNDSRFVSIPAFLSEGSGKPTAMIPRHCTSDYKIAPIEQAIRREILGLAKGQRIAADSEIVQVLGLSYDETGRIARVKAHGGFPKEFPLFEMELTRGNCKAWLAKQQIPHEVPRSACVFCPYHSNAEWRKIKESPEDWARAVAVDYGLRETRSRCMKDRERTAYVHRDCVPLDQADLDDPETKDRKRGQEMFGFLQECDGMCGV